MKKIISYLLLLSSLFLPGLALAGTENAAQQAMSSYDLFTPPLTDKSINYLGQVFGTVGGVVHGTSGQLLAEVFRVFNYAMVILAMCIIIYTAIMSIINTAQEGEFMGKQINSGWAIIRAVLAVGMLVPKYTGYSLIQVFIMWTTVQGVGLADKAWGRAIDYLSNEGGIVYAPPAQTMSKDNGMSKTFGVVTQMFNSEVCMYKLQDLARQEQTDAVQKLKADPGNPTLEAIARKPYAQYRPTFNQNAKTVSFGFPSSIESSQSVCGQYSWRKTGDQDDYYEQYIQTGVNQMVTVLAPAAKSAAEATGKNLTSTQKTLLKDRATRALLGATADYENLVRPALQRATRDGDESWQEALADAKQKGWIVAGSYYWDLAKINNELSDKLKNYQPTVDNNISKDKLERSGVNATVVMNSLEEMNNMLNIKEMTQLLQALEDKVGSTLPPEYKATLLQTLDDISSKDPAAKEAALKKLENQAQQMADNQNDNQAISTGNIVGMSASIGGLGLMMFMASPALAVAFVGSLGSLVGLWFGVMNSPGDPIAMIQQLGQGLVGIAVILWIGGAASLAISTAFMSIMGSATGVAYGIQNGLKLFVPILVGFIGVLFVNGMVLSVYVPMIPFLIFTFAAIGWLISVLEAIVAGPLVCASLTRPEGHDLLSKAEQAIILLMGVFLRPVVMIIGFLAAIILSRVALRIVNAGFTHAVDSAGITMSGVNLFGIVGVMIVYTMIVISIINLVFNAGVVKLWETIWMWIGFHQPTGASAEQAMQEIKGGVHSGAQVASDNIGGFARATSDTGAAMLQRGEEGKAGGFARNERTGKYELLTQDKGKGSGTNVADETKPK